MDDFRSLDSATTLFIVYILMNLKSEVNFRSAIANPLELNEKLAYLNALLNFR